MLSCRQFPHLSGPRCSFELCQAASTSLKYGLVCILWPEFLLLPSQYLLFLSSQPPLLRILAPHKDQQCKCEEKECSEYSPYCNDGVSDWSR